MKMKILNTLLLLAGTAGLSQAYASCTLSRGFTPVDISMDVGQVVVRPSDPVGTILVKKQFTITPNGSKFTCNSSSDRLHAVLTQGNSLSPSGGDSVYNTNIPGIGIRLYREAFDAAEFSGYYPYSRPVRRGTQYTLANGYFVVEIIKTAANVGSGTLTSGEYSRYYPTGHAGKPWLTSTIYGDAVSVVPSSCEIQGSSDKIVDLPTVSKSEFSGVGSTRGEKPFDLNILCNNGQAGGNLVENNKISLSFDYDAVVNSANRVITNSAPANTSAKGIGTQLIWNYKNLNQEVIRNEKLELGTLTTNEPVQYNVPMKARYYQTEPTVSPGTVRGMSTVTIQYE